MGHSQEEWKKIINQFRESGLSQRKWCAIHGEDRNRLQYWISKFQYLELGTDVVFAEVVTGGADNAVKTSE